MTDPMISLRDVVLNYHINQQEISILNGVNIDIPAHKTVSVVGPSGAGKTSLLMLLAGVERAAAGEITIASEAISHYDEDQMATFRSHHIGIVFQNFHLIPTMTALQNVRLAMQLTDAVEDDLSAAEAILKAVDLGHRMHHYPSQLSGGEQQRVGMARAFVTKPTVLLADEPTGNLDQANSDIMIDLLLALNQQHKTTLVMVTHDSKLASQTDLQLELSNQQLRFIEST